MQISVVSFLFLVSIFGAKNINPVDISEQCEFSDKTILSNCYMRGAWSEDELIIRDEESFQVYGERIKDDRAGCEKAPLPLIDFSKYSLLSKLTKCGCCSSRYHRKILKDALKKRIVYEIIADYEGNCSMLCGNFNWAIVPRIPEEYSVEFRVNRSVEIDSLQIVSSDIELQIDSLKNKLEEINNEVWKLKSELIKSKFGDVGIENKISIRKK